MKKKRSLSKLTVLKKAGISNYKTETTLPVLELCHPVLLLMSSQCSSVARRMTQAIKKGKCDT